MDRSEQPTVAVYLDFDNIVISRYDQVHGNGKFHSDLSRSRQTITQAASKKLAAAEVQVDAILDYATSFGSIAISRAYADWSAPANKSYRGQLVDRAVDLVQLFPLTHHLKNGADIRLSVDAMEDMFRIPNIEYIVIVAGDSDYVALAQKAKRFGKRVIGIGVRGNTGKALTAAVDEFVYYEALHEADSAANSVDDEDIAAEDATARNVTKNKTSTKKAPAKKSTGNAASGAGSKERATKDDTSATDVGKANRDSGINAGTDKDTDYDSTSDKDADTGAKPAQRNPSKLLMRALELLTEKTDEEWIPCGAIKNQILRMEPAFHEKQLGFARFTDFVRSRGNIVELNDDNNQARLRPQKN